MILQEILKELHEPRQTHRLVLRVKLIKRLYILFIQSKLWIIVKDQAHIVFNSLICRHLNLFLLFLFGYFYLLNRRFTFILSSKSGDNWWGVKTLYIIIKLMNGLSFVCILTVNFFFQRENFIERKILYIMHVYISNSCFICMDLVWVCWLINVILKIL